MRQTPVRIAEMCAESALRLADRAPPLADRIRTVTPRAARMLLMERHMRSHRLLFAVVPLFPFIASALSACGADAENALQGAPPSAEGDPGLDIGTIQSALSTDLC